MSLNLTANDIQKAFERGLRAANGSCVLDIREVCIENPLGTGCVNAFAIFDLSSQETELLRVEIADGTIIPNPVFVDCTCDCTNTAPCTTCTYDFVVPIYNSADHFFLNGVDIGTELDLAGLSDNILTQVNLLYPDVAFLHNKPTVLVEETDNGLLLSFTGCVLEEVPLGICYGECFTVTYDRSVSNAAAFHATGDVQIANVGPSATDTLDEIKLALISGLNDAGISWSTINVSGDTEGQVTIIICSPEGVIVPQDPEGGDPQWYIHQDIEGEEVLNTPLESLAPICEGFTGQCPCDCTLTAVVRNIQEGDSFVFNGVETPIDGDTLTNFTSAVNDYYLSLGLELPIVSYLFESPFVLEENLAFFQITGCDIPWRTFDPDFNVQTKNGGNITAIADFTSSCDTCSDCFWSVELPNFSTYTYVEIDTSDNSYEIDGFTAIEIYATLYEMLVLENTTFSNITVTLVNDLLTITVCTDDPIFAPNGDNYQYVLYYETLEDNFTIEFSSLSGEDCCQNGNFFYALSLTFPWTAGTNLFLNGELITTLIGDSYEIGGTALNDAFVVAMTTFYNTVEGGLVNAVAVHASSTGGGTGYLVNDQLTLTEGGGDAVLNVDTIGSNGAILTLSVVTSGTGYVDTPTSHWSGGSGTGGTVELITDGGGVISATVTDTAVGFEFTGCSLDTPPTIEVILGEVGVTEGTFSLD